MHWLAATESLRAAAPAFIPSPPLAMASRATSHCLRNPSAVAHNFTIAGDSVRDLQSRPFLAVHQWTRSELLKRMYAARSN